jgi:hypothetical protein
MQYRIGYVELAVSVNGGVNFYYKNQYLTGWEGYIEDQWIMKAMFTFFAV